MAAWNPQSRVEEILVDTINGTPYNGLPQSRLEELLLELKAVIEAGGGGGGTSNYNLLTNHPEINSHELIGDKTGADLGLVDQSASLTSEQKAALIALLA